MKTGHGRRKHYLSFVGTGQRGFYGKQAYAVDVLQEVVVQALAARLLQKPFKAADTDIHALLLIGLYQLLYT
ncbi:hypothetical protein ACV33K_33010, partial [Pseudomonas aeruginosa]